jgi:Putative zinc-finger
MSAHDADDRDALPHELLAAYADGELAPDECRRVEDWLAAHPEARAEVEAMRRLARLFDESAPPPPADERWAEALAGVRQRLDAPAPRRRRGALVVALFGAAAAVLLALVLKYPRGGNPGPADRPQPADEEVWSVVSADDVEILSMDDRDRGALVVGEPPVNEPMELLTEDEVQVNKLPDGQGRAVRVHIGSGAPYVVVSVGQPDPDEDP